MNSELPADNQLKSLIFSNFPILLDKKKDIYSNYVSFDNLTIDTAKSFRFPVGSVIIIDEIQKYYDSRDYKSFPRSIGVFCQHQRHGGIHDIYLLTQHPSRADNKLRQLAESFVKIHESKFIFGFAWMLVYTYYRDEDYGKPIPKKSFFGLGKPMGDMQGGYFDGERRTYLFRTKKVFNAYDSKYFRFVFERLPLKPYRTFTSKTLSQEQLDILGIDSELK